MNKQKNIDHLLGIIPHRFLVYIHIVLLSIMFISISNDITSQYMDEFALEINYEKETEKEAEKESESKKEKEESKKEFDPDDFFHYTSLSSYFQHNNLINRLIDFSQLNVSYLEILTPPPEIV